MDAYKSSVVACIATVNAHEVTTYKSMRFSTFTRDLRQCAAWLYVDYYTDVCMKSTGKCRFPFTASWILKDFEETATFLCTSGRIFGGISAFKPHGESSREKKLHTVPLQTWKVAAVDPVVSQE